MESESETEFFGRVAESHGLLRSAEAVKQFGRRWFRSRVVSGELVRVHRGVYAVRGAPASDHRRLLALTWAINGYATSRSTAALRGVGGYTLERLEVVRPTIGSPTRQLDDRVRIHRTNFLPPHHVELVDGIPSTTMARALCDLSGVVSVERLARIVDESKRRGLIEYDEIAHCREELRARGRRRTTYIDSVLETRVAGYTPGDSPPEDVVRGWLEDAGFQPVAQHRVVINGEARRLDLALVDEMVAVEYQGIDAHSTHGAVVNDSRKVTELQLADWFVVLVTKDTSRAEFLRQVRDFVARRHA